jgi:hypothetical protein
MSAEQLIALEAVLSDLSALYVVARRFAALRARAETELLPGISALGSKLRHLLRVAQLTDEAIAAVSREVLATAAHWHQQLDGVRASPAYQEALAALAQDDQARLATLVPAVFAGLSVLHPAPAVYFPVSPARARRRAGASPFLSPRECADMLERLLAHGLVPEAGGAEWWERELPAVTGAATPAALETPIAVRLAADDARLAVFGSRDEPALYVFTRGVRAPLSLVLASTATDEWWEAYEESYTTFRDALHRELGARGTPVTIWPAAPDEAPDAAPEPARPPRSTRRPQN